MGVLENIIKFPMKVLVGLRARGNSVVGIDIGFSSIKIVQLRKDGGRAILETYGELALGPYAGLDVGQATSLPAVKIAEALKDLVREANVTTKHGAFSIPLSSSLTTVISLPSVAESELKSMIPIEARKYIPVPISEVMLDFWVIPPQEKDTIELERETGIERSQKTSEANKTEVLLVAIHNSIITKYQEIAEEDGFDVSFLEIETFSAIRSLLSGGPGTFLLLDMGAAATNVSVVENGVVYQSHVINRGSQDITIALSRSLGIGILKAEEMKRKEGLLQNVGLGNNAAATGNLIMEGVFAEVNRVLLEYEKKQHKTIDKVILSGGGALLKGVLSFAKKNLETEVALGDPFVKVETPAFLGGLLKEIGPSFAVSLGVALRRLQESE